MLEQSYIGCLKRGFHEDNVSNSRIRTNPVINEGAAERKRDHFSNGYSPQSYFWRSALVGVGMVGLGIAYP